jgi:serine/threonine protein kinase
MSPERRRQIERLCQDALERSPEERAAFLAGACRNDPGLHREVLSLLERDTPHDLLEPATATQVTPGAQLGPYQIGDLLGAGGMGRVYRARDTRLHRTVAIKLLPDDRLADPRRKVRLLQEARAASALNHPNIVTLYDIASDNGCDFLVLEYVSGKTLAQSIPPKGLPLADALTFATQTAGALAAAHAAGIVHRDI